MGRDIALDVEALAAAIFLGIGESFVQSPVVEMVLELAGHICSLRRLVLRPPFGSVVFFPFALERFAVAGAGPELGLFKIYGCDSGIDHPLDVFLLEILQVVLCRDNVRHHVSVPDGIALGIDLSLVKMPFSVPFPGEIVLVLAPGDSGHEIDFVSSLFPGCDSFLD